MTFGGCGNKNRCVDKEDHDGVGDGGGGGAKQARKKMHLESFFSTLENPFRSLARSLAQSASLCFRQGAIKPSEIALDMERRRSTGLGFRVSPRLRECGRQDQAGAVSNIRNKIHETWSPTFRRAL